MKKLNITLLMFSILTSSFTLAYENKPITNKDTRIYEAPVSEYNPVKAIQATIVKLNQLTNMATYSPQMMSFLVNQEITPLFDFKYIADEVLSAIRVNLNDEEFKYFSNSLKQNAINTLLSKLAQGRSRSLDFIYARPIKEGNVIIVRLNAKGYFRYGFNLDLSFHKSMSGKWKVSDVALGRDSLIKYYQRMVLIKVRRYGVYGMLGRI